MSATQPPKRTADPAAVESATTQLRESLRQRLDTIAERMAQRVQDDVPEFANAAHPELWDELRRATVANVRAGVEGFGRPVDPADVPPGAERDLVRTAARAGLPLVAMLAAHRVAEKAYWECALEALNELDAPPEVGEQLIARMTLTRLDYMQRLSSEASVEFAAERDRLARRHDERRLQVVQEVLSAARSDLAQLGYAIEAWHLAVVASGPEFTTAVDAVTAGAKVRTLTLLREPGVVWAWLAGDEETLADLRDGAHERAARSKWQVGLGRPGAGATGFRGSHRQAVQAHGLASAATPVVAYDTVAVELLAGHDRIAAREFVHDELGHLAADTPRSRRARETLAAYLEGGQNAASAAATLGVSPRTVSYRLRAIENELGRTVRSRAIELHLALRLLAREQR